MLFHTRIAKNLIRSLIKRPLAILIIEAMTIVKSVFNALKISLLFSVLTVILKRKQIMKALVFGPIIWNNFGITGISELNQAKMFISMLIWNR